MGQESEKEFFPYWLRIATLSAAMLQVSPVPLRLPGLNSRCCSLKHERQMILSMMNASLINRSPQPEVPTAVRPAVARVVPLLLLLSRAHLTAEGEVRAKSLASALTPEDWQCLTRIAATKRGLPFVHSHIAELGLLAKDDPLRVDMRKATMAMAAGWLRFAAAQRAFLKTCLTPDDINHLFFKGVVLGRYYAQPSRRICRDIDVLIRADDVQLVIDRARAAGYRVVRDRFTGALAETEQDLRAVLRYKRDIPLLTPEGVYIELHTDIWHGAGFCANDALINAAEDVEIAGTSYRVMPLPELFCYLAHHHTRHLWSSLNWVADIAALREAPAFDEAEVRRVAERIGLSEILEATLAFDALCRTGMLPQNIDPLVAARAQENYDLCELVLEGNAHVEHAVYFAHIAPETDWRTPPHMRETVTHRAWRSRLTPNIDQYNVVRLPLWLHWTYPIARAMRGGVDRLSAVLRRAFS